MKVLITTLIMSMAVIVGTISAIDKQKNNNITFYKKPDDTAVLLRKIERFRRPENFYNKKYIA